MITLLDAPCMLGNHRATGLYRPAEADDFAAQWAAHLPALHAEHRGMKDQIHTGVANLGNTSPVLLRSAIERHQKVPFVLLHGYPYLSEAINLARFYENVLFDLSWLQLLSPSILATAL